MVVIDEKTLLIIILIVLALSLGRLWQMQKTATETSQIAFFAAFWACTEARGLKNSTVIQRVVEKYHPRPQHEELSNEARAMNAEIADLYGMDGFDEDDFLNIQNPDVDSRLGQSANLEPDDLV